MKHGLVLIAALMVMVSVGCVGRFSRIPATTGSLSDSGAPVKSSAVKLELFISRDELRNGNSEFVAVTSTGDKGDFTIARQAEWGYYLPLPADSVFLYRLCFSITSMDDRCFVFELFGPPEPPEPLLIECDLGSDPICELLGENQTHYSILND